MAKNNRLKKLARHLLATTCLTAGAAALDGQVVNEPTGAGDFGNTFATATVMPLGTTTVNGFVGGFLTTDAFDPADYITFQGLQGGTSFSFLASLSLNDSAGERLFVLNSSDGSVGSSPYSFTGAEVPFSASGSGIVPVDGLLTLGITANTELRQSYTINLTATEAPSTPEPGTLGAMGLGLAAGAAFTLRRKKKV
jgi:hypothetical protein